MSDCSSYVHVYRYVCPCPIWRGIAVYHAGLVRTASTQETFLLDNIIIIKDQFMMSSDYVFVIIIYLYEIKVEDGLWITIIMLSRS